MSEYLSSLYVIISIIIFILLTIIIYYYASKLIETKSNLYIISNILLITLCINFIIMFILMITYNKVKFTPGDRGKMGIRGDVGERGRPGEIRDCMKQNSSLGEEYIKSTTENLIRVEKPFFKK